MLERRLERYPIVSIEDPVGKDDAEGFRASPPPPASATRRRRQCNAVLIKPKQADTETLAALRAVRESGAPWAGPWC